MNDAKMNPVEAMPDPSRRKFLNTALLWLARWRRWHVGGAVRVQQGKPLPLRPRPPPYSTGRRARRRACSLRPQAAHGARRTRHLRHLVRRPLR